MNTHKPCADEVYNPKIPFTVVLIDDHPIIRLGAKLMLEKEGDFLVIGEAEGVKTGVQLISTLEPKLVILDLNLPDGNGFELLSEIRNASRNSRILIYTACTSRATAIRSSFLGANGFLKKAIDSDEILCVAKALMEVDISVTDSGNCIYHPFSSLSNREHQVLQRFAHGLPPYSIASELGISLKTVSSHKRNVLRRFNLNFVELICLYSEFIDAETN